MSIESVLIANRGEVALRIMRSARRLGLRCVALCSAGDRGAPHTRAADAVIDLGGQSAAESYLQIDRVIAAARSAGATAVHPGYGLLAESAVFAQAVRDAGLVFIGPAPEVIALMSDKAEAKRLVEREGVPVLPGYDGADQSEAAFAAAAQALGFPLLIKATAGGGGRGVRWVRHAGELLPRITAARDEAQKAFGDGRLLLERALEAPRHIEVQVLGDAFGNVVHLGERDCSIQRRHQKIVEEAPAPALSTALRDAMCAAAVHLARAVGYASLGTVEFLLDGDRYYFIETNPRLQVEHPVTEAVTGFDLVELQFRVARGEPLPMTQADVVLRGHAIEARLCAEDPQRDFLPSAGTILYWSPAPHLRTEHALEDGCQVSPHYDSLLAKLVAWGEDRGSACDRLLAGLRATRCFGVPTNRSLLVSLVSGAAFRAAPCTTGTLAQSLAIAPPPPGAAEWALAARALLSPVANGWFGFHLGDGQRLPLCLGCAGDQREVVLVFERGCSPWLDCAGVQFPLAVPDDAFVRRIGAAVYVQRDGHEWCFDDLRFVPQQVARRDDAGGEMRAPMSARVTAVLRGDGSSMRRGEPILTLEAMKVEHWIAAPFDGRVVSMQVRAGQQVAGGSLLAVVAPADPTTDN